MRVAAWVVTFSACLTVGQALAADPNLGRNLAATCATCHGTDGKVVGQELVRLAGMPANQMRGKLSEFKEGTRQVTIMHQIVKGFTDEQLQLIVDYFARQR